MKLKCLIIDDEPVARKLLEEYIGDTDFLEIAGKAENPIRATEILASTPADLMFLDINMPRMNGIEFLKSTPGLPLTIMTTAYAEYALTGFELDVIDYLVKPFSYERFLTASTRARQYHELKNSTSAMPVDHCFVKCDGKIEKVNFDELIYIEAMQNYVVLHTAQRKMIVYHTIKGIEAQLPAGFLKIHKSTIINTAKVKSIDGNMIDIGITKVQISQNMRDTVLNTILKDRLLQR